LNSEAHFLGDRISRQRVQDHVKAIALEADCFEPLSVLAKLFAQTANMAVHGPGNYRILISKNIREQNLSRLNASATLYQAGKQSKLDRRQIESAPFESNFAENWTVEI
jgi:hypothetical protein